MSTVFRDLPKLVEQDESKFTCWAASLEAWMSVTPRSPAQWFIKTQEDAISAWKSFCNDKSGLNVKEGFPLMAAGVGMDFKVFPRASQLSGAFLSGKLKIKGHIYLFFGGGQTGLGNTLAHAVVLYKVSNSWSSNCTVGVMDPWPGIGFREDEPLASFQKAKEAVVGWPE
jgi:hypothetical protein